MDSIDRPTASRDQPAHVQSLLVFPVGVDGAKTYIQTARQLGFRVIGGSSVPVGLVDLPVDALIHLPFVTHGDFEAAFTQALARHQISHVHAPHHGVWWCLRQMLERQATPSFSLCGEHPFQANWNAFQPDLAWADTILGDALAETIEPCRAAPPMGRLQYASLHRGFLRVPGESDEDKLSALAAIARLLPQGDVVEIGSLYGRSAYALARLAQHYGIGSIICVDPWRMDRILDQGPAAKDLYDSRRLIDLDHVFANFCATAAEVPGMGYIRQPSLDAIGEYREAVRQQVLHCPELTPVPVCGRIALLHIDGNHRYDQVVQDIQTWAPYLMPGGWLLLDDYVWSFGDGPQMAGDELLQSGAYDSAFVASDTLFLRRL